MRTGHLFAGAGGGLYADLILGHEPVFAVEWDDYAAGVLQRRVEEGWLPELHVHHGDVQLFDSSKWKGRVDSLHAGFPCQDISVAGNGAGIEGERSGLWSEVKRTARELGVEELFLENGPAITSRGLDVVLGDLAKLGFDARWCVLPASAVGAPHFRARWWCLARRSNANSSRELQQKRSKQELGAWDSNVCEEVSNSNGMCIQRSKPGINDSQEREKPRERQTGLQGYGPRWWSAESRVGRVANGMANRGNRIKCLGNGQVPLQAAAAYTLLATQFGSPSKLL